MSDEVTAQNVMDADPLVRPPTSRERQILFAVAIGVAALVVHVGATVVISGASWAAGQVGFGADEVPQRVEVAIIDVPPELEPDVEPEPEPEPDAQETKAEDTKPEVAEVKKDKPEPPPDPINVDDTPPPDEPVRRTVGLNLESTVSGGDGPSFNTGNTRMGETDKKANDPKKVDRRKSPPEKPPEPEPEPPPPANTKAQNIPTQAKVVKPKRATKVEPEYPSPLRAKGIEGTVVVRVEIDARGKVTEDDIVAKSEHPEFDAAARAAAMQETFEPATKDGKAISFSLSFSYRFRLN